MKVKIPIIGSVTLECAPNQVPDVFADLGIFHSDNTCLVDYELEFPESGDGDVDGMNDLRAEWGNATLRFFRERTLSDPETALSDLLCDLMHSTSLEGFWAALRRAVTNYGDETRADGS